MICVLCPPSAFSKDQHFCIEYRFWNIPYKTVGNLVRRSNSRLTNRKHLTALHKSRICTHVRDARISWPFYSFKGGYDIWAMYGKLYRSKCYLGITCGIARCWKSVKMYFPGAMQNKTSTLVHFNTTVCDVTW